MICSKCGRQMKISPEEKIYIRRFGSLNKICTGCGEVLTAYMHNIDSNHARTYRMANGICTQCGKEKATEGFVTCERCRMVSAKERAITKSIPLREVKPKKKKGYTLDELSKMSHDKGISYGDLVAILEGRKKESLQD